MNLCAMFSLDIETETEKGNAGGCWALFAKAFRFVNFNSTHADYWVMKKYGAEVLDKVVQHPLC